MKKFLFFIGLIFAISFPLGSKGYSFNNCPDCDFSNSIISINPENDRYLTYLEYQNVFDSADVRCSIGEFRIIDSSGTIKRLFWKFDTTKLDTSYANSYKRRSGIYSLLGQTQLGEDQILSSVAKTESFVYASHSTLKFFRALSLGVPCGVVQREPDTNLLSCDDLPFWLGVDNAILDTSEWVIQLISETTGSVLAVLDSVGFMPNDTNDLGIPYGTNPTRMNQTRQLPDEYAGERVYIRVSVRRYGPTPYGMFFNIGTSRINMSSFREYGICCNGEPDYSCNFDIRKFDYYYYQKVIEYLDSIVAVNNRPPKTWELPPLFFIDRDSSYPAKILDRYFERDPSGGWLVWDYNDSQPSGKKPVYEREVPWESQESRTAGLSGSIFVSKNGKELILTLKLNSNYHISNSVIEIFDFRGNRVISSKAHSIAKGYSEITLRLPDDFITKGTYLLVVKDTYGILFSDKFLVW